MEATIIGALATAAVRRVAVATMEATIIGALATAAVRRVAVEDMVARRAVATTEDIPTAVRTTIATTMESTTVVAGGGK